MLKTKWLPEVALQIAQKRREAKFKGEKERYNHFNAEFQRKGTGIRDQGEIRKPSSVVNVKK